MAGDFIDELKISINADAKSAINSIKSLSDSLESIKTSLGDIKSTSGALTTLSSSLRTLSNTDTSNIKQIANNLKSLSKVDLSNINSAQQSLSKFSDTVSKIGGVNVKDTGITNFVNGFRRLSTADVSKFDTSIFQKIANGVKDITNVGDISDKINRLVASLARLASSGEKAKITAENIKPLGNALKDVIGKFASAGGIPDSVNTFVTAIASLSNAGEKTGTTASNLDQLSSSLLNFFNVMKEAPIVSENTIRMTEALGQLASSGSKTGAAAKMLGDNINTGTSGIDTRLRALGDAAKTGMEGLTNAFEKAGSAVKNIASKIKQHVDSLKSAADRTFSVTNAIKVAIGTLIGIRGISGVFNWLKEAVMLGGEITEIDHIVESVFTKDMVGYVDTWAKNAIEKFGIAEAQAKKYAGTLTSMFQASQVGATEAGRMSMDLVGLAGDLAAFYNIDTETAYNKIRSGMAGMVRPLRDLGIDLTAATLQEYALAQGITKSYSAMTQAEKVMLRYNYLMDNTKTQQGDFERTNLSLANSLRTLQAYAQAVSTQLGVGLAAAIRPIIVLANTLAKVLLRAAQAFAIFMQTIFGKYRGGASGIATGLGDAADSAGDLADSAGGAAGGLGGAADAAKELNKNLSVLPFDELNQLNKDQESASSGGGGGGGGGGGLGDIGDLFDWKDELFGGELPDAISEWAKRIKHAFQMHDWELMGAEIALGINKGLEKIYKILDPKTVRRKVTPFIDAFTTVFNSTVDRINWDLMGRVIGRGLNDLVYIVDRIITGIDWVNLGKKFADGVYGFVSEVDFYSVGKLLGDKFMIFWKTLDGFVTQFSDNGGWKKLGKKLAEGVNGLNDAIDLTQVAHALTTGINGAFDTLMNFTQTLEWDDIATNIIDGLNEAIHNTSWEKNGKALGEFIRKLCDALIRIIDETDWDGFGRGLALTLQQIPWGKMLTVVAKAIVTALGGTLRGLASTPAGEFATSLINAIIAFKIGEKVLPFAYRIANDIGKGLTGDQSFNIIATALKNLLSGSLSEIALSAVGTAGLLSSMLGGIIVLGKKIAEIDDAARGGNGMLSQLGAGIDDFTYKLLQANLITKEQADQLFLLKEEQESLGTSTEDMAAIYMAALEEMGISSETAYEIAQRLISAGDGQTEVYEEIAGAAMNTSQVIATYASDMQEHGQTTEEAIGTIRNALFDLIEQTEDSRLRDQYQLLLDEFDSTSIYAVTAEDAYKQIITAMENMGVSTDEFTALVGEDMAAASASTQAFEELLATVSSGVVTHIEDMKSAVSDGVENIKKSFEDMGQKVSTVATNQAKDLETWQEQVSAFRESVVQHLSEVGQSWGSIDTEQGNALGQLTQNLEDANAGMETALTNMETLNSSNLDKATVQAILNQVDPSSEAMNDLIAHMNADDATWQEFYSNIQANLDLTQSIQETADGMSETFAEAIAPEFVEIGENFKVESGKIGGFMIDGIKDGVYDSTDEAVEQMKNVAYEMQDGFKAVDEIGSPSKVYAGFAEDDVAGFVNQLAISKQDAVHGMEQMAKDIQTPFNDSPSKFSDIGRNIGNRFVDSFRESMSYAIDVVDELESTLKVLTGLIDLYSEGRSAGESFAAGLESVYIRTPHIYVSGYSWFFNGTGFSFFPEFSVGWWRKGGLFKGGNGSVIGIAEDNRDEAVLPLEDRRAMARIGGAIAEASGGISATDGVADQLAERIADIIINTRSEEQAPMVYSELKVNDEVLARAVTRGQKKLDYRNNPTAQISY